MEWTLRGYRNGYEGKRVHSAEGTIGLEVPQIRGSLERLESVWLRANGKRSKRLLELVPMLYFKGPYIPKCSGTEYGRNVPSPDTFRCLGLSWSTTVSVCCSPPAAVERQQLAENIVAGDVLRPTVRGSHSRVKGFVRVDEPLRAGVVEVRQRALLEHLGRVLVARNQPLRIPGDRLVNSLDPFGRVEPAITHLDESSGFQCYSLRSRVGSVLARWDVGRQTGWEWECPERGTRSVAGPVF